MRAEGALRETGFHAQRDIQTDNDKANSFAASQFSLSLPYLSNREETKIAPAKRRLNSTDFTSVSKRDPTALRLFSSRYCSKSRSERSKYAEIRPGVFRFAVLSFAFVSKEKRRETKSVTAGRVVRAKSPLGKTKRKKEDY